jgi:hypothetical protein
MSRTPRVTFPHTISERTVRYYLETSIPEGQELTGLDNQDTLREAARHSQLLRPSEEVLLQGAKEGFCDIIKR